MAAARRRIEEERRRINLAHISHVDGGGDGTETVAPSRTSVVSRLRVTKADSERKSGK
jgi:hypothetical protein